MGDPLVPRRAMTDYLEQVRGAMADVDLAAVERFVAFLRSISGTVHVIGDGGSAALAEHLACDFGKLRSAGAGPEVRSLVENPALLTMLANDHGFAEVFARQLAISARQGDALLVVSGSGRSPNLLRAATAARERGIRAFGLLGFGDGGPLKALVEDAVVVSSSDYRVVEDVHHSIGHAAAAALAVVGGRGATVAVFQRDDLLAGARPSGARWRSGAREAVSALKGSGWTVVMLEEEPSNGAGTGLSDALIDDALIDLVCVCPHGEARCECRRPGTALLDQAARRLGLSARDCVIVGSAALDVVLGQRSGARTILVGSDDVAGPERVPDLAGAVALLLRGH